MELKRLAWSAVVSFGMACGGGEGETPGEGVPSGGGSEGSGGEVVSVPWGQMNHDQRGRYMADVVMPEMERLFQGFDAAEFAEFDCATCHGDNAREVNFEMPNGLDPLDPAQIPAFFQSQDRMAVFMTQQVLPKMADLLDEPLSSAATPDGFQCLNCHATAAPGEGHGADPHEHDHEHEHEHPEGAGHDHKGK